jgi:thiosulfate dehydrogenase (quinone) large subunit
MLRGRDRSYVYEDPPFTRTLFGDTRLSWLWLIVRLYLGYVWLNSGVAKLFNPAWTETGAALQGYWTNATQVPPTGSPPIAFEWYRSFIVFLLEGGHYTWFAWIIVLGEIAVGAALVLGAFTGIAAFVGAFLNWNFLMAGTASTNPVLFVLGILLILAWKTAGYIGLDRWLLPLLGTPWRPGIVFRDETGQPAPPATKRDADKSDRDDRAA